MYMFTVSAEFLTTIVASFLALALDYFPGLAAWFDALAATVKRQVVAGLIIGFALVIFAGQCLAVFVTNLVCDTKGFLDLLQIIFLAITVNQGVHMLLKPNAALKVRMFAKK